MLGCDDTEDCYFDLLLDRKKVDYVTVTFHNMSFLTLKQMELCCSVMCSQCGRQVPESSNDSSASDVIQTWFPIHVAMHNECCESVKEV